MSKKLKHRHVADVLLAFTLGGLRATFLLWRYHREDKRIMFSAGDNTKSKSEHTYMYSWESTGTPQQVRERQQHEVRRILKPVVRFFGV